MCACVHTWSRAGLVWAVVVPVQKCSQSVCTFHARSVVDGRGVCAQGFTAAGVWCMDVQIMCECVSARVSVRRCVCVCVQVCAQVCKCSFVYMHTQVCAQVHKGTCMCGYRGV